MSDNEQNLPRGSLEFVESSVLGTLIPASTSFNVEEALKESTERLDNDDASPLASISQRRNLFFDETLIVYVVLQTPYFDERTLRLYLTRLAITLEARIVNTSPENHAGGLNNEIIYTGTVPENEDPLIIVQSVEHGDDVSEENGHILVLWKQSIVLNRPARMRLQTPSVAFSATADLRPAEQIQSDARQDEYLPSQVPSGLNLLESFSNDPDLGNVTPRLSALRVSRVIPATQLARDLLRPLKNISRQSIRIFPAFNVRVRYTRPYTTPSNPSLLASLDVDITPFAGHGAMLQTVKFDLRDGNAEDLNEVQGMSLPLACAPIDDITFLYRLRPDDVDIAKTNVRIAHISITAIVNVSEECQPKISMHWQTNVDFTTPVNPGYGHSSQAIRRDHRPAQLSIGSNFDTVSPIASLAGNRPDDPPSVESTTRHQRSTSIPDFGVTMTFTDTSTQPVHPGKLFTWEVFIVNRSDRARKLALIVIPKRRRTERINANRPPSTGYGRKDPNVADAFLDENILHAMQRNSVVEPSEIICYSTDIRVGPLAPSACHTINIQFMALSPGVYELEAVRVIDVATQDHVDIRDLPSIIVADA